MNTCSIERNFEEWWMREGSKIIPINGDDHEEHAKRVAKIAWGEAMTLNTRNPQYEDGMTAEDDKRFNRQWDVNCLSERPAPTLLDVPHECMHAENGVFGA